MNAELLFERAHLVLAGEVVRGTLVAARGRIVAIDTGGTSVRTAADIEGDLLLPGLVELHTDNFERHLMPRPKVRWPALSALCSHDAEVAAAGITTVFDALGVGDSDPEAMRGQSMRPVLAAFDRADADGMLRAEHRLHVRCELPAPNMAELFDAVAGDPRVGLISLMDHTPGQRQWQDIEQARIYYCGKKGWSNAQFDAQAARERELQARHARPNRCAVVAYARAQGIVLASHDDTLPSHVGEAQADGVAIAEFPTRFEAAAAARRAGMAVVMGAPNVVRGGSHSGNVAAIELARAGLLDALSSDYVPASLLLAALRLADDAGFSLPQAIATVSAQPACAAGLDDRGEIAPGKRADLVQVRLVEAAGRKQPVVRAVWREGQRVV
ncbi:MAG: alpha-D-ribose 1-methylphosphonate 5-triphosphate diphosphatase [Betaproteobacteria bacterium]|nr:alpha-D-ribose 1-methylphosphonate 5-triphosphate diphosphatase [Betaproteobacteria bacterium]